MFAEILEQTGEAEDSRLLDMVRKQYVFEQVVRPSLQASIEYDADGNAQRWFPADRTRRIVLDPARNFGKPDSGRIWGADGNAVRRLSGRAGSPKGGGDL